MLSVAHVYVASGFDNGRRAPGSIEFTHVADVTRFFKKSSGPSPETLEQSDR